MACSMWHVAEDIRSSQAYTQKSQIIETPVFETNSS